MQFLSPSVRFSLLQLPQLAQNLLRIFDIKKRKITRYQLIRQFINYRSYISNHWQ